MKFFLGFFVNLLTSTYPNSKKSICPKNLKVLPIRKRQHLFIQTIIDDFVAIFEKKSDQKKNFFFQIFFFKNIPMSTIIYYRLLSKYCLLLSYSHYCFHYRNSISTLEGLALPSQPPSYEEYWSNTFAY